MNNANTIQDLNLNIKWQNPGQTSNSEPFQTDAFFQLLKKLEERSNLTMIELGSNDAFYTVLFNKFFENKNPTNVCVDLCKNFYELTVHNCTVNNCKNTFFEYASVGTVNEPYFNNLALHEPSLVGEYSTVKLSLTDIINKYNLNKINILHMDIQGSEVSVLREILDKKIEVEYIFVSIHSNESAAVGEDNVYLQCKNLLNKLKVNYIFDSEFEGGHGDGLIICEVQQ